MTAKELKRIFQKGECLSLDTMRLYNEGKLPRKSMHEVEKHLVECSLCSTAMDGLNARRINEINTVSTRINRRLAVYMNTPPRTPFFRRFGFAITTSVAVVSGGVAWWYFSQHNGTQSTKLPSAIHPLTQSPPAGVTIVPPQQVVNTTNPITPPPALQQAEGSVNRQTEDRQEKKAIGNSQKNQNLPASLPGVNNSLPIKPVEQDQNKTTDNTQVIDDQPPVTDPSSTRVSNSNLPVRIKSVTIYPPVTHTTSKSSRHQSKNGQLGESGGSTASFQLDEMPSFPGGDEALQQYLLANFHPVNTDRGKITRYATGVMFTVNAKTGEISSPDIAFSISPEVDAEILRVIKNMPRWIPGKKHGEVDVMIGFTLQ